MSIRKRDRSDALLLLKAMDEETASTNGATKTYYSLPEVTGLMVLVDSVSGTDPTLDIVIQGSADGQDWNTLLTLPQIDAAGYANYTLGAQEYTYYRYSSTIGGSDSPAFTYLLALTC